MSVSTDPTSDDPFEVALSVENLKRKSLQGSFATVLSQFFKMLIQLGSQVILARLLFPADFGLLAMIYPVVGFIQIFNDIGLGQSLIQRSELEQKRVSALFWVNMALSIGLACTVVAAAPLTAMVYHQPHVVGPMIFLGVLIPVGALGIHPTALLSRQMRFQWMAWNEVATSLIGVVVTIVCAKKGLSYWSLIAGQFASTICGNLSAWVACKWRPSRPNFVRSAWEDLRFGANLTGANLATFLTMSGDNMIVGLMAGRVALGLYDRSYRLVVQPISQILSPVSRVAVPLLSRFAHQPAEYRAAYLKVFRAIILTSVPVMLVCIMDGRMLIHVFLGPRWDQAGPIFSWICVGGLTSGIYSSSFWLFTSQDRTAEMRRIMTVAAVINILSYLVGIIWGIVGVAAMAAVVFVLITTPLVLYVATRSGPVHYRDLLRHGAPFVVRSILIYALLAAISHHLPFPAVVHIAIDVVVAYGTMIGLCLFSGEDRSFLGGLVRTLSIGKAGAVSS